jgi:hypothetical protein
MVEARASAGRDMPGVDPAGAARGLDEAGGSRAPRRLVDRRSPTAVRRRSPAVDDDRPRAPLRGVPVRSHQAPLRAPAAPSCGPGRKNRSAGGRTKEYRTTGGQHVTRSDIVTQALNRPPNRGKSTVTSGSAAISHPEQGLRSRRRPARFCWDRHGPGVSPCRAQHIDSSCQAPFAMDAGAGQIDSAPMPSQDVVS